MDNNKFFKTIWRINAILMLLALIAVGSISAYKEVHRWLNPLSYDTYNYSTSHTNTDTGDVIETRWIYNNVYEVSGKSGSVIPLQSARGQQYYFTRNLLFVDNDLENRWVLPHNDNIIWGYELLAVEDNSEVTAIIYDISKCNDDWCEEWSGQSIYLSRPDGSELTQIVTGISRRIGQSMMDVNHVTIFYVKDEVGHAAKVSLRDFAIVQSEVLSPVE